MQRPPRPPVTSGAATTEQGSGRRSYGPVPGLNPVLWWHARVKRGHGTYSYEVAIRGVLRGGRDGLPLCRRGQTLSLDTKAARQPVRPNPLAGRGRLAPSYLDRSAGSDRWCRQGPDGGANGCSRSRPGKPHGILSGGSEAASPTRSSMSRRRPRLASQPLARLPASPQQARRQSRGLRGSARLTPATARSAPRCSFT